MKTVYEIMMDWREHQVKKHELPANWAKSDINELSNVDFLQELSEAIEERLESQTKEVRAVIHQRF